ncbi:putative inner membrane transporter YedA [Baekduia alba]|uniref:EamA family transporter n=1 Tax=Baekduia alba TaxID=2997333 RepID=UPI002341CC3F|nr:EamA family transporter [Baekduia alba]WCB93048.1 putative inner membrane transporter YedA [Baekduia alba]
MASRSAPTPKASPPQVTRVWVALGAIYLIWGSTYLAIRLMVETVPPALGAGVRFLLAGGAMLVFLAARRGGLARVRVSRSQLLWTAIVGSLLAAGGNGLVTVAEQDVPSGLAALLIATEPLLIVLLRGLTGDRVGRMTLGGVALGFVGVGILMLPGGRPDDVPLGMTLLVVVASLSWALGSFISPRVDLPRDPLVSTGWSLLIGGGVLVVCGLIAGEGGELDVGAFSTKSILAFAYLVVVGSIVAFSCYSWLLANAPISQVSTYAYVNPVIAVVLGAVFLSEDVMAATIAGMALVIASVVVIVRRETEAPA